MAQAIPLLAAAVGSVLFILIQLSITRLKSPLQALPGPWYSRWTHLVLKWHVVQGRRVHYIHNLHQRHGPVVRIGPYEAAFSDLESFKTIHKIGSGFVKSPWYQSFRDQPAKDLFTFVDTKAHAQRRKLMARPLSYSELKANWEEIVRKASQQTVAKINNDARRGTADIFKWWTLMAYDVITNVAFGESAGLIQKGQKSSDIIDLESVVEAGGLRSEMGALFDAVFWLPIPSLRKFTYIAQRVSQQGWTAVENATKLSRGNIFTGIVEKARSGEGTLSGLDAATEAQGLIIAGSGTTAVTLTYLVWAVLQRPKLVRELAYECNNLRDLFHDEDLEKLPILNAVINETLRLYGAAPGSLPRTVPPQGAALGGYTIPAGVTTSTQAFSIHRNPQLFSEPEIFDHSRWLKGNESRVSLPAFHPYGAGARTCIGQHLAGMEMRYAVAFFFRECAEAKLAETTTDATMAIVNYFLIHPAAQQCDITLI